MGPDAPSAPGRPILLVHGIWDDGTRFDRMRAALERADLRPVATLDLLPNDGSLPIEALAEQVDAAVEDLLRRTGEPLLDLVGFSMGALVSRYWLQRMGGRDLIRRFLSISGPHHGTLTAYALGKAASRQMRPGSPLLRSLAADPDPWGEVEVHTLWTPFDLMIVPPRSSRLPGVRSEQRVAVPLHRWMITHRRALDRVIDILGGPVTVAEAAGLEAAGR